MTFPEVVSFPLRQRLALNFAFEDSTIPAPHVTDEEDPWGVIAEEGAEEEEDLFNFCICNENAPQCRKTKLLRS